MSTSSHSECLQHTNCAPVVEPVWVMTNARNTGNMRVHVAHTCHPRPSGRGAERCSVRAGGDFQTAHLPWGSSSEKRESMFSQNILTWKQPPATRALGPSGARVTARPVLPCLAPCLAGWMHFSYEIATVQAIERANARRAGCDRLWP